MLTYKRTFASSISAQEFQRRLSARLTGSLRVIVGPRPDRARWIGEVTGTRFWIRRKSELHQFAPSRVTGTVAPRSDGCTVVASAVPVNTMLWAVAAVSTYGAALAWSGEGEPTVGLGLIALSTGFFLWRFRVETRRADVLFHELLETEPSPAPGGK